jgi:hypothetical protein
MVERDRDVDDGHEASLDPELLYTKEYCIGRSSPSPHQLSLSHSLSLLPVASHANMRRVGGGSFGKVFKGYVRSSRKRNRGYFAPDFVITRADSRPNP